MSDYSELMSDLRLRQEHKAAEVIENLLSDREKQRRLLDSLRGEVAASKADAERYRWLLRDADHAAALVDDTYTDWDIDQDWREMLNAAIDENRGGA